MIKLNPVVTKDSPPAPIDGKAMRKAIAEANTHLELCGRIGSVFVVHHACSQPPGSPIREALKKTPHGILLMVQEIMPDAVEEFASLEIRELTLLLCEKLFEPDQVAMLLETRRKDFISKYGSS